MLKPYRNAHTSQSRIKLRAQIILALGSGIPGRVCHELGISTATLHKWKNRWNEKGIESLTTCQGPETEETIRPKRKRKLFMNTE